MLNYHPGRGVGWERQGSGPVLMLMHGGGRAAKHYRPLAAALSRRFTVVTPDRRGRGLSPAAAIEGGLERELEDAQAVLEATGAEYLLGHSAGAAIALQLAARVRLRALAVYEPPIYPGPGVPPEAAVPLAWRAEFETALAAGDDAAAFVMFIRGLELGAPRWVPQGVLRAVLAPVLRFTPQGRELAALLHTIPHELEVIAQAKPDAWPSIGCPVCVLRGESSPAYLRRAAERVHAAIAGSTLRDVSGAGHNGPDYEAPERVAALLLDPGWAG